jgi:restriction system protein
MLADDDVGLVTTAGFTKDAEDEARTQQKRKVTLVNLERLFDLWVEHHILPQQQGAWLARSRCWVSA